MQNKVKLKKYLLLILIISLIFLISFLGVNIYEHHTLIKNNNYQIASLVNVIKNNYPNISDETIITILNEKEPINVELFNKYGIDLTKDTISLSNVKLSHNYLVINLCLIFLIIIIFLIIFLIYDFTSSKEIKNLTKYLEELNKKNYSLKITTNSEDELSILRNEIYKTTIMLKEMAEINAKDKLNLKKSLEDISHQLRTPLTSILVMLDNLIDDNDIDLNTQNEFLRDIKRQTLNISFLVENILKLSKFDANTIKLNNEKIYLHDIIRESAKNVAPLSDLKNIKVNITGDHKIQINGDLKWQVEALTNILKNSLEYSSIKKKRYDPFVSVVMF